MVFFAAGGFSSAARLSPAGLLIRPQLRHVMPCPPLSADSVRHRYHCVYTLGSALFSGVKTLLYRSLTRFISRLVTD